MNENFEVFGICLMRSEIGETTVMTQCELFILTGSFQ